MKKLLVVSLFVVLLLGGCTSKDPLDSDQDPVDENPHVEQPVDPKPEVLRSFINGAIVEGQTAKIFGIMIENSSAAWPHSGISHADVVYEVYMEDYSVTRFLAIFSQFPSKVGPVRSARVPFVWIMKEWMIPYAHYGSAQRGLGDAYTLIKSISWPIRFDGVSGLNDDFYFRDNARTSPHNAYFNASEAMVKLPELEIKERFLFDEQSNVSEEMASRINITYTSTNKIEYVYNSSSLRYDRFINGKAMMDANTKSQIDVKNVIVQYADHSTVESINYVLVDLVGSGKAIFFVDGRKNQGSWIRESEDSITRYFLEGNIPLVLSPGNTWIQVVSDRVKISFE